MVTSHRIGEYQILEGPIPVLMVQTLSEQENGETVTGIKKLFTNAVF